VSGEPSEVRGSERNEPAPRAPADRAPVAPTDPVAQRHPRPIIERIGLAAVALVLAILFGGVAAASWIGGELFLAVMGAVGCLMTLWVGALTLFRG
jgi:fatty acid desaturase